jgi:FkbM family methyltransferase
MPRAPLGYGKEDHFIKKGYKLHGVIHVGMNDGEEITWYWHVGRLPVLGFEPIYSAYMACLKNYAPEIASGQVYISNCALGNKSEALKMTVSEFNGVWDTKGATGLGQIPAENAIKMGWIPNTKTAEEMVVCSRFDDWVGINDWALAPYDTLVIDVQGMELQVLEGFGRYIYQMKYLMIECSETPLWNGEASGQEITNWLEKRGFTRDSPIVSHNDVMFIRTDLIK